MRVYLPRVEGRVEASKNPLCETRTGSVNETILIVEDDDQLRQMIAGILRANGYTVLEAENGTQAVLLSERLAEPVDLMLSDIVMPGMNGRMLAEKMTDSRRCRAVLFMSGYTGDAIPGKASILLKPFTHEQLLERLRSVLNVPETHLIHALEV